MNSELAGIAMYEGTAAAITSLAIVSRLAAGRAPCETVVQQQQLWSSQQESAALNDAAGVFAGDGIIP